MTLHTMPEEDNHDANLTSSHMRLAQRSSRVRLRQTKKTETESGAFLSTRLSRVLPAMSPPTAPRWSMPNGKEEGIGRGYRIANAAHSPPFPIIALPLCPQSEIWGRR